jgi:AcrR family transcriptional regulator
MAHEKRTYRKSKRAELEEQTRLRLTEAAVELHGTVGPARTSMSAVAERAGVRRSTLYRHFADEDALFDACSAHWAATNPLPDLGAWGAIRDPSERLSVALGELYAFYERNEPMLSNLLRDESVVASVAERFAAFRGYIDAARDVLLRGRGLRGRARRDVGAAIGHALSFGTWRSLVREQGMGDDQAVAAMRRFAEVAAEHRSA